MLDTIKDEGAADYPFNDEWFRTEGFQVCTEGLTIYTGETRLFKVTADLLKLFDPWKAIRKPRDPNSKQCPIQTGVLVARDEFAEWDNDIAAERERYVLVATWPCQPCTDIPFDPKNTVEVS